MGYFSLGVNFDFSKQAWCELSPLFEKAPEIRLKFDLAYENRAKFVTTTIEFALARFALRTSFV